MASGPATSGPLRAGLIEGNETEMATEMAGAVRRLRNFIDGAFVDASDGPDADIIDPSTGEAIATAPVSGAADVDAAFGAAAKAFGAWSRTTPSERQRALLKIADALEARADEFVEVESANTGKPIGLTASEELPPCVDQLRFFAGAARLLEGRVGR